MTPWLSVVFHAFFLSRFFPQRTFIACGCRASTTAGGSVVRLIATSGGTHAQCPTLTWLLTRSSFTSTSVGNGVNKRERERERERERNDDDDDDDDDDDGEEKKKKRGRNDNYHNHGTDTKIHEQQNSTRRNKIKIKTKSNNCKYLHIRCYALEF